MKLNFKPVYKDWRFLTDILYTLACISRWSYFFVHSGSYNESCKQGLNGIITWFLAQEAVHEGATVDFTVFPKIAIKHGYNKSVKCDIHEPTYKQVLQYSGYTEKDLDDALTKNFRKNTSKNFRNLILYSNKNTELENRIFRAAIKIATLAEIKELQHPAIKSVQDDLWLSFNEYSDIPGFKQCLNYLDLFIDMSRVRHKIRWDSYMRFFKFADLAHMNETGWLQYMLSLSNSDDQELATRHFFIGVFHDLAEAWTGDIPSPFKKILPNFREGTEKLELEMLQKQVYSTLPDYQVKALQSVMLEEKDNEQLKNLGKVADYLDAAFECYRMILTGNHTPKFIDVFLDEIKHIEKYPPELRKLLMDWYCSIGAPEYQTMVRYNLFAKI